MQFEYSLGAFGEVTIVDDLVQRPSTRDQLILNLRGEMVDDFTEQSYKFGRVQLISLDSNLRAYTEEDTGLFQVGLLESSTIDEDHISATIRVPRATLPSMLEVLRSGQCTEFSLSCEEADECGGQTSWHIRNVVWSGAFGEINP